MGKMLAAHRVFLSSGPQHLHTDARCGAVRQVPVLGWKQVDPRGEPAGALNQ